MSHILRREKKQPLSSGPECPFMGFIAPETSAAEMGNKNADEVINWKGGTTGPFREVGHPRNYYLQSCGFWKLNFSLSDFLCSGVDVRLPFVARSGVGLEERGNRWLCRNEKHQGWEPSPSSDVQLLALSNDLNAPFWVVTFSLLWNMVIFLSSSQTVHARKLMLGRPGGGGAGPGAATPGRTERRRV